MTFNVSHLWKVDCDCFFLFSVHLPTSESELVDYVLLALEAHFQTPLTQTSA